MGYGPATILLLFLIPAGTAAQSLFWAGYGRNTDDASGLATGEHLSLGLGLANPVAGLGIGVGLPVDGNASSRWGSLGGWFDLRPVRRAALTLGLRGSATAFVFSDPVLDSRGAGSVAGLDGVGEIGPARARVQLRAGGRHGAHSIDGDASNRLLGRVGAGVVARTAALGAGAHLDHWRAEEGGYTQATARVDLDRRRFQLWAGVDHWLDADLGGTGWEAGVRVPVTRRAAVVARGGVQAADILFWIPAQRTWSLGVQVRTGADPMAAVLPVPVLDHGRRSLTLTLPAGDIASPAVAGTFSGWERIPMERVGGEWRLELVLPPGVHEYAFVTADGTWFVPEGTPGRKPDGFGGHVAMVIVQ